MESESFDVALLVAVLGEVPDRSACLGELRRVLCPEGLLSIAEFRLGDPDFIPKPEMIRSVEDAGFRFCATNENLLSYTTNFRKAR